MYFPSDLESYISRDDMREHELLERQFDEAIMHAHTSGFWPAVVMRERTSVTRECFHHVLKKYGVVWVVLETSGFCFRAEISKPRNKDRW